MAEVSGSSQHLSTLKIIGDIEQVDGEIFFHNGGEDCQLYEVGIRESGYGLVRVFVTLHPLRTLKKKKGLDSLPNPLNLLERDTRLERATFSLGS
jgi:hypothetical protein